MKNIIYLISALSIIVYSCKNCEDLISQPPIQIQIFDNNSGADITSSEFADSLSFVQSTPGLANRTEIDTTNGESIIYFHKLNCTKNSADTIDFIYSIKFNSDSLAALKIENKKSDLNDCKDCSYHIQNITIIENNNLVTGTFQNNKLILYLN